MKANGNATSNLEVNFFVFGFNFERATQKSGLGVACILHQDIKSINLVLTRIRGLNQVLYCHDVNEQEEVV